VIGSMAFRISLFAASLCFVGGSKPVSEAVLPPIPATKVTPRALVVGGINSRVVLFRGDRLAAPPGVRVLSDTSLLIGTVTVDVPEDVAVEFNEKGEAVFTLAKDAKPHPWVLTVGRKRLLASATARAIVPLLGVGEPRIEWSHYMLPVAPPRSFLHVVQDLKDPFDASPYR
jgi:hypothetical protein